MHTDQPVGRREGVSVDLLAVAPATTPLGTRRSLGVARAQIIGEHLFGESRFVTDGGAQVGPLPRAVPFRQDPRTDPNGRVPRWEFLSMPWPEPFCREHGPRSTVLALGKSSRRSFGWRRMATDGTHWRDSDFPARDVRSRMVRQHLAAAVQGIRDATGYDVITEAEVDDCAPVLCPASWHGLLLLQARRRDRLGSSA